MSVDSDEQRPTAAAGGGLVGLGAADGDFQALFDLGDVGQVEGDEFGAAGHHRLVEDQDEPVALRDGVVGGELPGQPGTVLGMSAPSPGSAKLDGLVRDVR